MILRMLSSKLNMPNSTSTRLAEKRKLEFTERHNGRKAKDIFKICKSDNETSDFLFKLAFNMIRKMSTSKVCIVQQ